MMKRNNTAKVYYLYQFIASAVLGAVWTLIAVAFLSDDGGSAEGGSYLGAVLSFIWAVFGSMTVYYLVQYLRFKNMRFTRVQQVKLEHTATGLFRRVGFEVTVDIDGAAQKVQTKPVFCSSRPWGRLSLDDYAGFYYDVGFCETSGEWVVLL
jgi:hypothetical protein